MQVLSWSELTYLMQNLSAVGALSLWFVLHFLIIIKVKVQMGSPPPPPLPAGYGLRTDEYWKHIPIIQGL